MKIVRVMYPDEDIKRVEDPGGAVAEGQDNGDLPL